VLTIYCSGFGMRPETIFRGSWEGGTKKERRRGCAVGCIFLVEHMRKWFHGFGISRRVVRPLTKLVTPSEN